MYTYTLGGTLYKRPLVFHALLTRAIFMFSENVFLFWDCLDFGVFLRIGSRRNPSWRNSCVCQCQELGEVSFNSLLLGRHQSEDNTTTGLEHPHGSPGYRVSPLKNGPRVHMLRPGRECDAHWPTCKGPCSYTDHWRRRRFTRLSRDWNQICFPFFIITRISELRGDQTHTLQGKV